MGAEICYLFFDLPYLNRHTAICRKGICRKIVVKPDFALPYVVLCIILQAKTMNFQLIL